MLSIGEFSNICKVSTKTLRYYAEVGLLLPNEINPENGYRYYAVEQLETMLFINRLKTYNFSLDEIKAILESKDIQDENLCFSLVQKKIEIAKQIQTFESTLKQMNNDILSLKNGKSIMSYLDDIDIKLVEVEKMYLISIRKRICEPNFANEYKECFHKLLRMITDKKLTAVASPMVLFHDSEFTPLGLDTEFAIPVKERATGTRDFSPGLCIKTVLCGSYLNLASVYTKQREWADKEGYESSGALHEVYQVDPSMISNESELITEVYYPVKKKTKIKKEK